ncbi:MAG: 30S ribosomal protein S4 [Candidatus Aenigmarchaeota archaeon]|nr:30S ribosomal protein S4 [Candidatus Aenigmarchaeota archaeon]
MGHPKKQRKKYERPLRPFDKDRIDKEKKLLQSFGLRRKREVWRTQSILRNFRQRARALQAKHDEQKERILFEKLNKLGISCSKLEDILDIGLEDILDRRLQTLVYKKGYAHSVKHARQLIVHGHVIVDRRKILWPSYLVPKVLEEKIILAHVPAGEPKTA